MSFFFQLAQENCQHMEETCSRKDTALRQSRLVTRFKEEALKRLEKARKEKTELSADEKDQVIVSRLTENSQY